MQRSSFRGQYRTSSRPSNRATIQDTVAVFGLAVLFYLMFASVAAYRDPDWTMFWLAAAVLVLGWFFYGRCMRAILDILDDWRAARELEDIGSGAE